MGRSIWLLNGLYRLDVYKAGEREYIASLSRVADNSRVMLGRGYDAQTAAGDLHDGLTLAGLDELAQALDADEVVAQVKA